MDSFSRSSTVNLPYAAAKDNKMIQKTGIDIAESAMSISRTSKTKFLERPRHRNISILLFYECFHVKKVEHVKKNFESKIVSFSKYVSALEMEPLRMP